MSVVMKGTGQNPVGIARKYAVVFGIAYVGLSLTETIVGRGSGLSVGGTLVIKATVIQNLIHWSLGLAVLGSFLTSENTAKALARLIGIVFLFVAIGGFLLEPFMGVMLGFDGPLPLSYTLVHLATALAALFAGYVATRAYGQE